jgi:hypothetical protein
MLCVSECIVFNEPGFEAQMGTPLGDASTREYNATIRVGTVE